jgi:ubiquitin-like protein Pup
MVQKTQESKRSTQESTEMTDEQLKAAQDAGKTALEGVDDASLDQLLSEIDDVLEENAEEFVTHFIQRGGQ